MTKEERRVYDREYRKSQKYKDNRKTATYKATQKRYRDTEEGKVKRNKRAQAYHERHSSDPAYRLMTSLRARQGKVLRGVISTTKGLGCSSVDLRSYIESKWTDGMCWDNYGHGVGCWVIDHIQPLDLIKTYPDKVPELVHYTNLQPMWFLENIKKSNKTVA